MDLLKELNHPYCFQMNRCRRSHSKLCESCASNETLQERPRSDYFDEVFEFGQVPIKHQCQYCLKHHQYQCSGRWDCDCKIGMNEPCYQFEHDPDGRILRKRGWFSFKIKQAIPRCGEWDSRYEFRGADCKLRFDRIVNVQWSEGSSPIQISIYAEYTIQVNDLDFDGNAKVKNTRPNLQLVK